MEDAGLPAMGCSCLAACDRPPAVLRDRDVLPAVSVEDVARAEGDWTSLRSEIASDGKSWLGHVGPEVDDPDTMAINLLGQADWSGKAFAKAAEMSPEEIIEEIETSGLQGRGGAGFSASFKWNAVRSEKEAVRYVVLNGDESEPGTFKDREILMRRPDLVVEGLAIAAYTIGARDVYLYLRGEFAFPKAVMAKAVAAFESHDIFPDVRFHMHSGQGCVYLRRGDRAFRGFGGQARDAAFATTVSHRIRLVGKTHADSQCGDDCVRACDYFKRWRLVSRSGAD